MQNFLICAEIVLANIGALVIETERKDITFRHMMKTILQFLVLRGVQEMSTYFHPY